MHFCFRPKQKCRGILDTVPGRVLFAVIASVIVIDLAGCGGGVDSVRSTQAHATTGHPRAQRAGSNAEMPCTGGDQFYSYSGRILGIVGGYFAPGTFAKEGNMWWTGTCQRFTAVGAGSDPAQRADGLLAILRQPAQTVRRTRGTVKTVKVPNAGALKITKAPIGPGVETWAQERGDIEFKGTNGVTGTLHLSDDTVTLNK
jgi:hypothetical protein